MPSEELLELIHGTADVAFAVDTSGLITVWNSAAEEFFGLPSPEAIGTACHEILQGSDECGLVCSAHCTIQQALERNHPVANFDLRIQTATGKQWCNISVLTARDPKSGSRHAVHIVRPREMRKRMEVLMRDFLMRQTGLESEAAKQMLSSPQAMATNVKLTARESEVLRLLASGSKTKVIANQLNLRLSTVNNHIRHILDKLDAHSRLEAIRRAERAGLL